MDDNEIMVGASQVTGTFVITATREPANDKGAALGYEIALLHVDDDGQRRELHNFYAWTPTEIGEYDLNVKDVVLAQLARLDMLPIALQ